MGKVIVPEENK